jgi:beta-lactam-binding protein with PASTA domain
MDEDQDPPRRRGHPVLAAFLTSLVTTAAVFIGLTMAERRGHLEFLHGSRGPTDVEVPSITGATVEQARELLRARELLLMLQAERPDPSVPAGSIAAQIPLAGSRAPRGSAIQAFVSSGAGTTTVPNLAGFRPEDAVEQLRARKLVPGRRQETASETVAAGLVLGTDPPASRAVAPGATITLVISTGPAPRPVPRVLGLRLSRAKKILEEAGFKVGSTRVGSSDRYDEETIIKQEPADKSLAVPGTPIDLVVND